MINNGFWFSVVVGCLVFVFGGCLGVHLGCFLFFVCASNIIVRDHVFIPWPPSRFLDFFCLDC